MQRVRIGCSRLGGVGSAKKCVRHYAKTPFSFIPNEEKHIFENEKLTPEQNDAAIPPKPEFKDVSKYHHDMKNPEDIADVITKFNFNDFMISALSDKATILGDPAHKFILKDGTEQSVSLHFANMTRVWTKIFNEQIIKLSDISPQPELNLSTNTTELTQKYEQFTEKFGTIFTVENLERFYRLLGSLDGPQDYLTQQQSGVITFEAVSSYLAGRAEMEDPKHFEALVNFIIPRIEISSQQGIVTIIKAVINKLKTVGVNKDHLSIFNRFVEKVEDFSPIKSLDTPHLDDLAYFLIRTGDLARARDALSTIISRGICPSSVTVDEYFLCYHKCLQKNAVTETEIVKDLSLLKPVIFHRDISPVILSVLLEHVVRDPTDLSMLLRLVNNNLLEQFQHEIFTRLLVINETATKQDRALQIGHLVRYYVDKGVILNPSTETLIKRAKL